MEISGSNVLIPRGIKLGHNVLAIMHLLIWSILLTSSDSMPAFIPPNTRGPSPRIDNFVQSFWAYDFSMTPHVSFLCSWLLMIKHIHINMDTTQTKRVFLKRMTSSTSFAFHPKLMETSNSFSLSLSKSHQA